MGNYIAACYIDYGLLDGANEQDDYANLSYQPVNEAIDPEQTIIANFEAFGGSSLDCFIYCLTRTTNWVEYHAVKQDVLLRVLEIVHQHGADIAFPTRTVQLEQDAGPLAP